MTLLIDLNNVNFQKQIKKIKSRRYQKNSALTDLILSKIELLYNV